MKKKKSNIVGNGNFQSGNGIIKNSCGVIQIGGVINSNLSSLNFRGSVEGNGNIKSSTIEIDSSPITTFTCELACDLTIQSGCDTPQLSITADENILPMIKVEVVEGELSIFAENGFSTQRTICVNLKTQQVQYLNIKGSGDTLITDCSGKQLLLALLGSGNINAKGNVDELKIRLNGSGDINTSSLLAKNVEIDLLGSGDIVAYASDSTSINLMGSGDVMIKGSPAKIRKSCLGSGSITIR